MTVPKGRFLVVRGGAIGDFILTLPVCAALRQMFPDAHIELMGYSAVTQLALKGGPVDGVRNIDARPMTGFFFPKGEIDGDLSEYFGGFNVVVSYLFDPDKIFQDNVRRCGDHIQFVQGCHRPSDEDKAHATESLLKALEILAIFDANPVPKLNFNVETPEAEAPIAVHPGSGSPEKNWPVKRWVELLRELGERHRIVLIVGEADTDTVEELKGELDGPQFEFMEKKSLLEVGVRLQSCRAFIGHDSGITHLAAAVGLPGICLWGETNKQVWRPRSDRFEVLSGGKGLMGIAVEDVVARTKKLMEG